MTAFPDPGPMWTEHRKSGIWEPLKDRIGAIRNRLSDEESKRYLDRVCHFWSGDYSKPSRNPKCFRRYGYNARGANPKRGDIVADCGAYIGDDFPHWLECTEGECKIVAIEPNGKNIVQMREHFSFGAIARSEQCNIVQAALGEEICGGWMHLEDSRSTVHLGYTDSNVAVLTLDALFGHSRVDYIKIDTEGSDLAALKGGARVIKRDRPTIAACAYHKPSHIVEIPELLLNWLSPCHLYAGDDPDWGFHIHYIAVPIERSHESSL